MSILHIILILICLYFLYSRFYKVYSQVYYYKRQGVPFHSYVLPFFGSFLQLAHFEKYGNSKLHPVIEWNQQTYGNPVPPLTGIVFSNKVCLIVNQPEVVQELFISKNKYYDKHHSSKNIVSKIAGDSILFSKSNHLWSQKRKVMSASLYKEKLIRMTEVMKQIVCSTMEEWDQKGTIDIVQETSNLFMKIIFSCLFGRKNENPMVEQMYKGERLLQPLGQSFQASVGGALEREFQIHLIVFIELMPYYISKSDKELAYNAEQVRNLIRKLIKDKRAMIEKDGHNDEDLLGILLQDDLFKDHEERIVDECVTFFIAGSQTSATTTSNLICYLTQQSDIDYKLRESLKSILGNFGKSNAQLSKEIDIEKIDNFDYLKLCFYESMRIEPPVAISSSICITEDQDICGVKIRANDMLIKNIYQLHHNEKQWIDHDQFIPERFDPSSKFFLTPSGHPRHIMSFIPFSGGKRVCLGKTFAETAFKFIMPIILNTFEFEFVNEEQKKVKPQNNVLLFKRAQVLLKLKRLNPKDI